MASDAAAAAAEIAQLTAMVPSVLGPIICAVSFNAFLYGLCFLQFARYIVSNREDNWTVSLTVWWSFIMDTAHTATVIYLLWFYVVANFNDLSVLSSAPWPFTATPVFTIAISVPIQFFFAWRVKQFSGSWTLWIIIAAIIFSSAVLGIAQCVFGVLHPAISNFDKNAALIYSWLGCTSGCDTMIAGFMLYYLTKSRTGFKKTDTVITRLIHYSVETTLITALFCILEIALFCSHPQATYYTVFAIPIGRLYSNTLLIILNSRQSLRNELHGDGETSLKGVDGRWNREGNRNMDFTPHYAAADVKVDVDQQICMDAFAVRPHSGFSRSKVDISESDNDESDKVHKVLYMPNDA